MFYRLHTGCPWRDLPERYGPWKTVYDRFARYRRTGLFEQILERLQIKFDGQGRLDWELFCVDGSNVRATHAAAGAREKRGRKTPRTTRWAAHAAGLAPSSTWWWTVRALP